LCRAIFDVLGSGVDEDPKFFRRQPTAVGAELATFRRTFLNLTDSEDGDSKLSLKMPVTVYQYTRRHIPEDSNIHVLFI
jgi:hypothetical protein